MNPRTIRKQIINKHYYNSEYLFYLTAVGLWAAVAIWVYLRHGNDWEIFFTNSLLALGIFSILTTSQYLKIRRIHWGLESHSLRNSFKIQNLDASLGIRAQMNDNHQLFKLSTQDGYWPYTQKFGLFGRIDLTPEKFEEIQLHFSPEYINLGDFLIKNIDQNPLQGNGAISFTSEIKKNDVLEYIASTFIEEECERTNTPLINKAFRLLGAGTHQDESRSHALHLFRNIAYNGENQYCLLHTSELGLFEFNTYDKKKVSLKV